MPTRLLLPIGFLLLLPACEEIEEIFDEPAPAADTIESGSFDRLWNAAEAALARDFDVVREDRATGRILARGRQAESYVNDGARRYYSDLSAIVVEIRIDSKPPGHILSVRAAQEAESGGAEAIHRYSARDRSYRPTPLLMPASSVEQAVLREIRKEVQRKP